MYFIGFDNNGWQDYSYWKTQDRKTLKKIDSLIDSIMRNPFEGIGKPEPLRGDLSSFWSRRIDEKNRIIYKLDLDMVIIVACYGHYDDK
jgi:toxin YoeB